VSVLDCCVRTRVQPAGGVETDVTVFDVANSSSVSPAVTPAGSVTRWVADVIDAVADARNAMSLAGGSTGDTSWTTSGELAASSSVTKRRTESVPAAV